MWFDSSKPLRLDAKNRPSDRSRYDIPVVGDELSLVDLQGREKFDSVSLAIGGVKSLVAREVVPLGPVDIEPKGVQLRCDGLQLGDIAELKGRVCFECWSKRIVHPDVDLGAYSPGFVIVPESHSALRFQILRLVHLCQSKTRAVEQSRGVLRSPSTGNLDMVQPHRVSLNPDVVNASTVGPLVSVELPGQARLLCREAAASRAPVRDP